MSGSELALHDRATDEPSDATWARTELGAAGGAASWNEVVWVIWWLRWPEVSGVGSVSVACTARVYEPFQARAGLTWTLKLQLAWPHQLDRVAVKPGWPAWEVTTTCRSPLMVPPPEVAEAEPEMVGVAVARVCPPVGSVMLTEGAPAREAGAKASPPATTRAPAAASPAARRRPPERAERDEGIRPGWRRWPWPP